MLRNALLEIQSEIIYPSLGEHRRCQGGRGIQD